MRLLCKTAIETMRLSNGGYDHHQLLLYTHLTDDTKSYNSSTNIEDRRSISSPKRRIKRRLDEKILSFSLIERVILSAGAMLIFSVSFQIDQMPEGE